VYNESYPYVLYILLIFLYLNVMVFSLRTVKLFSSACKLWMAVICISQNSWLFITYEG